MMGMPAAALLKRSGHFTIGFGFISIKRTDVK
jgi:hypothetical protein